MKKRHKNLGTYLKHRRQIAGLTQDEVGRALGYKSGHQFVSNWERGLCLPPLKYSAKLAQLFKISRDEFAAVLLDEYRIWLKIYLANEKVSMPHN